MQTGQPDRVEGLNGTKRANTMFSPVNRIRVSPLHPVKGARCRQGVFHGLASSSFSSSYVAAAAAVGVWETADQSTQRGLFGFAAVRCLDLISLHPI